MLRKMLACFTLLLALGVTMPAFAATPSQPLVPSRIAGPIDNGVRVVLKGNVYPLAQARYDRGPVAASMPASRLMLVLKPSTAQAEAAREFIDSLQNKSSPNYHKWLTPDQFGAKYGPSNEDLETITNWLRSEGFTVGRIARARNVIEFSGTAGEVEAAFHTSIHTYMVNGQTHYANATNPEIPAALAPVVAGVTQLHNFQPSPDYVLGKSGHWTGGEKSGTRQITWTDPNGNEALFVDPADVAAIYNTPNANLNPAYSGKTYDGTGVTIGIAGDSNFTMQDVANYRAFFLNDNSTAHLPNVIVDGNDPGVVVTGDAVEALLDNEVAGGVAPGANIDFYTAQDTDMQSGLFLAIARALNDNAISILNLSFGGCEAGLGQSGNQLLDFLWQQAAAQGISVTVSTGDSGSANCDDPDTEAVADYGLAVSGFASTPYNVAVGGTDFGVLTSNYPDSFNQYMNPNGGVAPYYGSALGYIPETIWNDSTTNNTTLDLNVENTSEPNIAGGGGGMSSCSYLDSYGDCLGGYGKPAYQTDLTPSDGVRDLPDVALFASNGYSEAAWALCGDNVAFDSPTPATDCQLVNGKPTSASTITGIGGTSASSPAFAGMLALISEATGGRLGNPLPILYKLAETDAASINDVTVGNNSVACAPYSSNCNGNDFLTGYNSGTGYDLASGLGSVNASQLLTDWQTVTLTPSSTSLELGESSSSLGTGAIVATHGTPIDFSIAVNPAASVTGTVTLITDSDVSTTPDSAIPGGFFPVTTNPNTPGVFNGNTDALPGGTYNVYAYYAGDTNYAASKSNPVPVTINPENSATSLAVNFYDASSQQWLGAVSVAPYGSYFFATATPQSLNATDGIPTGTVAFLSGGAALGTPVSLDSAGEASFNSLSQNALAAGSYKMTASYSGDASYNPSVSQPFPFTITQAQISMVLTSASSGVNYGGSIELTASIGTDSIGSFPSGSVTFMSGSQVLGSAPIVGGYSQTDGTDTGTATATIAGTQFTANGESSVTAVYAGDKNYGAATSNGLGIEVTGVPVPKIGVNAPANLSISSPGASASTTVTVTPFGGFTGVVNITCIVTGPSGGVSTPVCEPASATVSGTAAVSATLNIDSTSTTTTGNYSVTIIGADAATGKITASTTVLLTVNAAPAPGFVLSGTPATVSGPGASATSTITVTPSAGFTGPVTLTCSATGLSCGPATATVGASGGTATLNISAASTITPGSYSLIVNGVDSTGAITASTTVQVTVNTPPVPSLTISATAVTIASPGATAPSTITLTPAGGFTGTVTLTCSVTSGPDGATSAPTCASTSATIADASSASATLNLQTTSTTTPGAYTLTVTATAGGATAATTTMAVTVVAPVVPPGFALSGTAVNIASLGASGNSTITVTPAGGFTGQVNLQCALATSPSGANDSPTCSFGSNNNVVVTGSSPVTTTMTVATSTTATASTASYRGNWFSAAGGTALAGLFLIFIPARRRKNFAALVLLLIALGSIAVGCGGGSTPPVNGTGSFTFTVTGTDAATGSIVSNTAVTVTVQ